MYLYLGMFNDAAYFKVDEPTIPMGGVPFSAPAAACSPREPMAFGFGASEEGFWTVTYSDTPEIFGIFNKSMEFSKVFIDFIDVFHGDFPF